MENESSANQKRRFAASKLNEMGSFMKTIMLIFLMMCAQFGYAQNFEGRVVRVMDGDTIAVLVNYQERKVRLAWVDAPEKAQDYGTASRAALSELVFAKQVKVDTVSTDRYGRTVGKVTVNGVDVGLSQVQNGLAWHYVHFSSGNLNKGAYEKAQSQAQAAKRGLWAMPRPVPPWDWRKSH